MAADYLYEYEGEDSHGLPLWSCRRVGAGIVGFGHTQKDALADFLDKEQELVPLPKSRVIFSSRYEPSEFEDVREPDPDEYYEDFREGAA